MDVSEEQKELTDVALCYQSMGVQFDSSAAEIEQRYRSLAEEYKKTLGSADPAKREEASQSLELIGVLYDKIRTSITYRAVQKDYQKKSSDELISETQAKRTVHKVVAEMSIMRQCPRCNGLIGKELKTCPICKSPVLNAMQKILRDYFTPGKVVVYCLVIVAVSLSALRVLRPEAFSRLVASVISFADGETDQAK